MVRRARNEETDYAHKLAEALERSDVLVINIRVDTNSFTYQEI